ncbi:hypothetical protein [Paraburkholderia bryophila]|uniref:Uncharacterized protein n=1 Tax=Paraburkholderia bryophila TaxID=420952 RepID=A0A7Y9WFM0_9BURK|nr:hypothetical protein [Paraburkholderia bryophila]NYH19977.1 hypothetical protein [Paraburkholderia bryophila]
MNGLPGLRSGFATRFMIDVRRADCMPGMRLIWIMKGATDTSILFTRTAIELLKAAPDLKRTLDRVRRESDPDFRPFPAHFWLEQAQQKGALHRLYWPSTVRTSTGAGRLCRYM